MPALSHQDKQTIQAFTRRGQVKLFDIGEPHLCIFVIETYFQANSPYERILYMMSSQALILCAKGVRDTNHCKIWICVVPALYLRETNHRNSAYMNNPFLLK